MSDVRPDEAFVLVPSDRVDGQFSALRDQVQTLQWVVMALMVFCVGLSVVVWRWRRQQKATVQMLVGHSALLETNTQQLHKLDTELLGFARLAQELIIQMTPQDRN